MMSLVPSGDSLRLVVLLGTNNDRKIITNERNVTGVVQQWNRYLVTQNVYLVYSYIDRQC